MVEENVTPPEETVSLGRKIVGFILANLLIPILFVGTCIPLGLGFAEFKLGNDTVLAFSFVYACVFGFLARRWAAKRKNRGGYWGTVFAVVVIVLYALFIWIENMGTFNF